MCSSLKSFTCSEKYVYQVSVVECKQNIHYILCIHKVNEPLLIFMIFNTIIILKSFELMNSKIMAIKRARLYKNVN